MKQLLKYPPALFTLLFIGYGPLFAHAYKEPVKDFKGSEQELACLEGLQNNEAFPIGFATLNAEKQDSSLDISLFENEREEDELTSSKKCSESSNYATALFYTQPSSHLLHNIQGSMSFHEDFYYRISSGSLYLLFLVVRI